MKIDIRSVLENKLNPAEQEAESEQTVKSESASGAATETTVSLADDTARIVTEATSDSHSEQAEPASDSQVETRESFEAVSSESSAIQNTSAIGNDISSADDATRIAADTALDSVSEQSEHIADSQAEPTEPEIADDAAAETTASLAAETGELSALDNISALDNVISSSDDATRITTDTASDSVSEQAEYISDSQVEPADISKSESADDVTDSSSEQAGSAAESEEETESAATPALAVEADEKAVGDFAEAETEAPAVTLKIWLNKYGSLVAIAVAMVALLAVLFAYTTMTPRTLYAEIDGSKTKIVTKEHTVEGFITDEGISYCEEDFISRPLTCFIHDGMELEITHATDFSVTADGKTVRLKSLEKTVGEALEDKGYDIRKRDIVTPERDALLEQNMKIVVQRVETEEITVKEKVPFKTVNKDDSSMAEGETKVITEGKHGKDKVTYEVTYIDGEEASRQETARENIKPAADEVVAVGTKVKYNGKLYSRKLLVKAYSYTGGGTTAMGTRARVGEIAVDPSVIPLGTNVYIPGVGARRAEDTGGNIKGNTIDIYMNTQSECINWGVRYITIYIE